MRFSSAILTVSAVGIAGVLFLSRLKMRRQTAELVDRCEKAELEMSRLEQLLSTSVPIGASYGLGASDGLDMDHFGRLEHDLRSTLSVIAGFSALIKESAEKEELPQAEMLLKGASAIQQSASKALRILDTAAEENDARRLDQGLRLQGKR